MSLIRHYWLISLKDFQICPWLNLLNRGFNGINLT